MVPDPHRKYQCCGSGSESGSTCFWASWIRIRIHWSEVWIRIRIRILLSSSKNCKKSLDSYFFVTLFDFLSGSGSGSISQRHGSKDPDPDPPQNGMDPQHWKIQKMVGYVLCITCRDCSLLLQYLRFLRRTYSANNTYQNSFANLHSD